MICPSCDTPNRDDAKFCKKCGHPFRDTASKTPEAANVALAPTSGSESEIATDDPSLAPTQIISPQKMLAFHASRWQKEQDAEPTDAQVPATPDQESSNEANMPTLPSAYTAPSVSAQPQAFQQDVADMPTVLMDPFRNDEPIPIPPPPPAMPEHAQSSQVIETVVPPVTTQTQPGANNTTEGTHTAATTTDGPTSDTSSASTTAETSASSDVGSNPPAPAASTVSDNEAATTTSKEEDESVEQTQSDQSEQDIASADFPALAVGTTLIKRYEITQVISEGAQEHIYEVTDHQGYQHCWNCGSEQNREGDEFCIDCGAELLNASYTMHEYPATENQSADAGVLQGSIMNTFVDQGRTYVIEQVQATENAFPTGVHLIAACDSDAGNVRRSEPNEDSTLVLTLQRVHESKSAPSGVFIVADGLGGHDNGQVASHMAINVIAERMVRELLGTPLVAEKDGKSSEASDLNDEDRLVGLLQGSVEDANAAICQVNQHDKTDMGSTITGFMVVGDFAYILNVGDSRTYMLRGGQIYQLTNDHSLVGQLVAGGLIQPDDVYTHPQRSQIFRSLGDKLNVQIDIFKQQLHPGDILLSCSDGLWEMVRNPQIESILNNAPDPQMACTQLLEAANTNGGEDNVSAVVVFVR